VIAVGRKIRPSEVGVKEILAPYRQGWLDGGPRGRHPRPVSPLQRGGLAALVVAALLLAGRLSGATAWLTRENVRDAVQAAGPWGLALFVVLFCLAELVHEPGLVMVAAGVVAYGPYAGFGASFVGALASVTVSFLVVRAVGGTPLAELRWAWARRMLARLEGEPLRVVVVLRLMLWMFPPLNYALALSPVRFRDYLVGSAVGLVVPLLVFSALFHVLLG
jgi:uncharacterized membrane protein YdjX (TVP38/TMEM64 family)